MKTVTLPPSVDYASLIAIARTVSRFREWSNVLPPEQAFEIAYDAVNSYVMRGQATTTDPRYLSIVARTAIRTYLANQKSLGQQGPKFARYWAGDHGFTLDPTVDIDECIALRQAMAGLEPEQREDLEALADTFDGATAAKRRGVGRVHFVKRCRKARQAFFSLWFEGETPPALPKRVVNHA